MDVGQPKDYLIGMGLYLSYIRHSNPEMLKTGTDFIGNVLLVINLELFLCEND